MARDIVVGLYGADNKLIDQTRLIDGRFEKTLVAPEGSFLVFFERSMEDGEFVYSTWFDAGAAHL